VALIHVALIHVALIHVALIHDLGRHPASHTTSHISPGGGRPGPGWHRCGQKPAQSGG